MAPYTHDHDGRARPHEHAGDPFDGTRDYPYVVTLPSGERYGDLIAAQSQASADAIARQREQASDRGITYKRGRA